MADLRPLVRAELTTPLFANRGRLMSTCRTTENTNTTNSPPTQSALSSPRATRTLASAHPSSMMHTFVARCPTTFGPCTPHCTRSRALAILTGTLLTEPQTRSLTLSAPVPNRRQVWHRRSQMGWCSYRRQSSSSRQTPPRPCATSGRAPTRCSVHGGLRNECMFFACTPPA